MGPLYAIGAIVLTLLVLTWIKVRRYSPFTIRKVVDNILQTEGIFESSKPRSLDITVVFTNLNDFVTLFGKLGDTAGVALLNEYYSLMTPIVRRHHGFLCQYEFDRLFFFFGAIFEQSDSNHAAAAIQTVLDMQGAMDLLNQRLAKRAMPQLRMRAGIATAKALVGDIGSEQFCQFTAIGPAVNMAKRLEQACKKTDARNLVSKETRMRAAESFRFRAIDPAAINGTDRILDIFEALEGVNGR